MPYRHPQAERTGFNKFHGVRAKLTTKTISGEAHYFVDNTNVRRYGLGFMSETPNCRSSAAGCLEYYPRCSGVIGGDKDKGKNWIERCDSKRDLVIN